MLVDKIQTVGFQMRTVNMEFKKLCKDANIDFSDFNLEGYESNFLDGERSSKPSLLLFPYHILPNRK